MLPLLQILTSLGKSRYLSKNADHDPMHLEAAIPVSTEEVPVRVEVVVDLVLQVVQVAKAAVFLKMLVVATSSSVAGRLATLRPGDVVMLRLSEQSKR